MPVSHDHREEFIVRRNPWWSMAWRLVLPAALAVCLFSAAILVIILPAFENTVMERKREMLRELTQLAFDTTARFHKMAKTGEISSERAQAMALDFLRNYRYGPDRKDYFWINDHVPRVIMHPYRPDLENKNVSGYADPNGKLIFVEVVRQVEKEGAGYVDYMWQWMDSPSKVVPKVSYVREFKPWGWIIGTGVYIEDVKAEMAAILTRITAAALTILAVITLLSAYLISNSLREQLGRIKADEARVESERRFRTLVENSKVGIFIIQAGQVQYMNPEQRRLFGDFPEPFDFSDFKGAPEEELNKLARLDETAAPPNGWPLEMELRLFPLEKQESGRGMNWVHCRANKLTYQGRDALLVIMMDITQAKELEHLIMIQDKMASLGRIAAGIAHEIRNPLSGINMYVSALEDIFSETPDPENPHVGKVFTNLKQASQKIETVVKRVLDFAKPSRPRLAWVQINDVVHSAVDFSSVTLRKNDIRLEMFLTTGLNYCYIDVQLVEQVLMNLITNAVQAMQQTDGAGRLTITTDTEFDRIVVQVIDNGPGIPSEIRDRIFDPFFTIKKDGSGIGLSLSHRIITDHGGSLEVKNADGGGAEFVIQLPALNNSLYESVG